MTSAEMTAVHVKDLHLRSRTQVDTKRTQLIISVFMICFTFIYCISSYYLVHKSIRLDESQSLWQTSHSLRGTLRVVAQDVHVPLYHVILHYWQILFGQTIQAARTLSLLFFMVTLPVIYLLSRKVLNTNWSLVVTALCAFSPFLNWYANEARMYTLLILVATLSQYYFVTLIQTNGKKGFIGYAISALIGVYAHYFFLFNLAIQGSFFLFNRRSFIKGTFLRLVSLVVLLTVMLSPWIRYFLALGAANNTSPMLPNPSSIDFFNVFSQFTFGYQSNAVNTFMLSTWPILVLVALAAVKSGQTINRKIAYIVTAAFGPVVLALIVSYIYKPFFLSRYMVVSVAPLTILVVWFISHYTKKVAVTILAVIVMLIGFTSYRQYTYASTPVNEDYKSVVNDLNTSVTARDIIVLSAPFTIFPFSYYYDGDATVTTLPLWDRTQVGPTPTFDTSKLEEQVRSINVGHQYVYVVLSYNQGYEEDVYQYYQYHYEKMSEKTYSPGLKMAVYRVGYAETKPIGGK